MNSRMRPFALGDLGQHRLQPLLELAAVLGAGEQSPEVEREHAAVLEPLRHVAADDALGQSLDDRRLADPGFADQHRVVLCLAREDADRAADLRVAADHRVHLAGASLGDQVDAVLLERLVRCLGVVAGHALRSAQRLERFQELRPGEAGLGERRCRAVLALKRGEQQVLDRNVVVAEGPGLVLGPEQELLQVGRDVDLAEFGGAARHLRLALEVALDSGAQGGRVDVEALEEPGRQAVVLVEQREQQMFASDLLVAETPRPVLGAGQGFLGLDRQLVRVHIVPILLLVSEAPVAFRGRCHRFPPPIPELSPEGSKSEVSRSCSNSAFSSSVSCLGTTM